MEYTGIFAYNTQIKIAGQDVTLKRYKKKQVRGYGRKESSGKLCTMEQLAAEEEKNKKIAARRVLNALNAELSGQAPEINTEQQQRFIKSVYRAKERIFDIIACNAGQWGKYTSKFVTLTFAGEMSGILEANAHFKDFIRRLNYAVYGKDAILKYICIPELQDRGSWHYHVLFFNLPLIPVNLQKALQLISKGKIKKGYGCTKNLADIWGLGFVGMNAIKDNARVAAYVTKYLTKGIEVDAAGKMHYYTEGENKGLKRLSDYALYKRLGLQNMKRYQASKGLYQPKIYHAYADIELICCIKDDALKGDKLLKLDKQGKRLNRYTYNNKYRGEIHIINLRLKKNYLNEFVQKMDELREQTRRKYKQWQHVPKLKRYSVDMYKFERNRMYIRITGFELPEYISKEEIDKIFPCVKAA